MINYVFHVFHGFLGVRLINKRHYIYIYIKENYESRIFEDIFMKIKSKYLKRVNYGI